MSQKEAIKRSLEATNNAIQKNLNNDIITSHLVAAYLKINSALDAFNEREKSESKLGAD